MYDLEGASLDLSKALELLALSRPVFHSEADFQHALAWEIQRLHREARVRLEVPLYGLKGRGALDIVVTLGAHTIALELKYCKAKLQVEHEGERFILPATVARDLFRHDVCKDIWRVEHAIATDQAQQGFVIALTNDPGLWADSGFEGIDTAFKLHSGRTLSGTLSWSDRAGGTAKGRDVPIRLAGEYRLDWQPFSVVQGRNGQFRVLLIPFTQSGVKDSGSESATQSQLSPTDISTPEALERRSSARFQAIRTAIRSRGDVAEFTIAEIEGLVGKLPASALKHNAWWCHVDSHAHACWELDGYKASPRLTEGRVRFRKSLA